MRPFSFQVLGANSAAPLLGRFPSAFALHYDHESFLIDCGEGCQIKMKEFGVKPSRINSIFISHLHGDHIFGLPGLLNSYNLNQRSAKLRITGPKGIREYVEAISRVIDAKYHFDIEFIELQGSGLIDLGRYGALRVKAFPLKHRIPTFGYSFVEEIKERNIDPEAIEKFNLTIEEIKSIKAGSDLVRDGQEVPLTELTLPQLPSRSFAYCSDTLYDPELVRYIDGIDMIYHEATYTHDLAEKARERMHSTALEAARIAALCKIQTLIIGHYSSRYRDLSVLLDEAKTIFPNTFLALEGLQFDIKTNS